MRLGNLRDSDAKGLTRINTDFTDKGGLFCGASICFGLVDFSFEGFFLEVLKSRVVVEPIGCGKNDSSGFVGSCGGLWLIFDFVGVGFWWCWVLPVILEVILSALTWRDCGELCGVAWCWVDTNLSLSVCGRLWATRFG
jgi:hypothetical protein